MNGFAERKWNSESRMRENRPSGLMRGGKHTVIGPWASQSVTSRLLYLIATAAIRRPSMRSPFVTCRRRKSPDAGEDGVHFLPIHASGALGDGGAVRGVVEWHAERAGDEVVQESDCDIDARRLSRSEDVKLPDRNPHKLKAGSVKPFHRI